MLFGLVFWIIYISLGFVVLWVDAICNPWDGTESPPAKGLFVLILWPVYVIIVGGRWVKERLIANTFN